MYVRESPSSRRLQIVHRPAVRAHNALRTESLMFSRLTKVLRRSELVVMVVEAVACVSGAVSAIATAVLEP